MATVTASYNWVSETVTPAKMNLAAAPTVVVADNEVTTAKILDANVTAAKLSSTLDLTGKTVTLPATSVTAAKLDGAQTGSAPIYGCRAWVNFDGTTANNIGGTYSRTGTTVTVDATVAHGLQVGHVVYLDFTSGTAGDGTFTVVTAPTTTQFTVTHGTSGATSGNVTLNRRLIRASGNVANVSHHANGDYSVNFSVAMPDANYAALATIEIFSGGTVATAVNQSGLTAISARVVSMGPTFNTVNTPALHLAIFR